MSKLEQDQQPGPSSPTPLHNRLHGALEARRRSRGEADNESEIASDSELFDELERELEDESGQGGAMGRIREARWKELRSQMAEIQAQRDAPRGLGRVTEPTSEKELIQLLGDKGGELKEGGVPIVVHFYHKEFRRCDIMGRHLEMLASLHPGTMFVKMSVLDSPFLVEKLGVKVLPELVVFGRRAEVKDRITGFEDLGNSDGFTTKTLEWRLAQGGELLTVVTLFSAR
ncbi:hypothetical protein L7F22_050417 [Adiantum nelumboides]|nr:hypothetical protein [Adiantum nelumboides]